MAVTIDALLAPEEVAHIRSQLESAEWIDGRITAGAQSALAKHNLQLPESAPQARALGEVVLKALARSPLFSSAALPLKVFPPLFNRYEAGMGFGAHVDNAIRFLPGSGGRVRTDVSATLFLTNPADYDGGELVIEDAFGEHRIKLSAGSLALYPSSSLHRVEPVTRGSRWASFFWVQSMVRGADERTLLYGLDRAIGLTRAELGDAHAAVLGLTASYHNLLRKWAEA